MDRALVIDESDDGKCSSAEELMDKLDPRHSFWKPSPSAWIFRGHADDRWELLATAHRLDGFAKFRPPGASAPDLSFAARQTAETTLLKRFHKAVDASGLPIPVQAPLVARAAASTIFGDEPIEMSWPLRALAQHHRLPTGLLDWSRRPRVAAYFAAKAAAQEKWAGGRLDVWALRADVLEQLPHHGTDNGYLVLYAAPRSSNPNLHAQSGLFTVLRGAAVIQGVDTFMVEFVAKHRASLDTSRPVMRRLSLAQSFAPKLLQLLADEGVTGSSLFPNYDGVADSLREQALWHEPPEDI